MHALHRLPTKVRILSRTDNEWLDLFYRVQKGVFWWQASYEQTLTRSWARRTHRCEFSISLPGEPAATGERCVQAWALRGKYPSVQAGKIKICSVFYYVTMIQSLQTNQLWSE